MTSPLRSWLGVRFAGPADLVGASGSFRRNALTLTVGTFTAQALPLVLYPVFTRLYHPADFGVFATLSLFVTVAGLLASGAYEHAILIAGSPRQAAQVTGYALLRSAVVLTAMLVAVLVAGDAVTHLGVRPAVVPWLALVPPTAAALVVYNCYAEWCVRERQFAELSRLRMWQTSAIAGARLVMGLVWTGLNGVVLGDAVGKVASAVRSAFLARRRDGAHVAAVTVRRARAVARRYARVARFALPDNLINNLSGSVHVLFLGSSFGDDALGFVTLVLSVMYVPVTVVSSAVKDVFRQRANAEYRTTGTCRPTYRRLVGPITALAVVGFGALYAVAPLLFPLLLGEPWRVAGDYARILTPMFFANFVSMSLGGVLVIAERTDVSLAWQVANLVLTVASLVAGTRWGGDISTALWCFTIGRSVSYLLYMALSYHYAERRSASHPVT